MAVRNAESKTFYSIVDGKIRKRVSEGTEGAVERENKKGNIVHELVYGEIFGVISNINIESSEYGQNIHIVFEDGDILSIPFSSRNGQSFIKMLKNIESDLEVTFQAWLNEEGNTAFAIKQKDQYVKWAFTRENPNGMPQAVKKTIAGQEKWDFSEQEDFLYKILIEESKRFGKQYDEDVPDKLKGVIPKGDFHGIPIVDEDKPSMGDDKVKLEDVPF